MNVYYYTKMLVFLNADLIDYLSKKNKMLFSTLFLNADAFLKVDYLTTKDKLVFLKVNQEKYKSF